MLNKTWFIDIDGTILKHLNYSSEQDFYINFQSNLPKMELLKDVKDFFRMIPSDDVVILTTARDAALKDITEKQMRDSGVRFDSIIFNCGTMERIVVNDIKPPKDGDENKASKEMLTAYACNVGRNEGLKKAIKLNSILEQSRNKTNKI